jgi:hypothetical protein
MSAGRLGVLKDIDAGPSTRMGPASLLLSPFTKERAKVVSIRKIGLFVRTTLDGKAGRNSEGFFWIGNF